MKTILITIALLFGLSMQAQSYDYYETLHDRYQKKARTGGTLTGIGVSLFVTSYVVGYGANSRDDDLLLAFSGLGFITSFVFFNVGVPIWTVNAIKKRNNWHEMQKRKPEPAIKEIVLGATNNGIGLIVKL